MSGAPSVGTQKEHRAFAKATNSRVWQLLEQSGRSPADDDELLYAAFASCYRWLKAGTAVHQQRGEYLVARAYLTLGNPAEALRHARRCRELTDRHRQEMEDFDLAFAHEILARACAASGLAAEALAAHGAARAAGATIGDAEDRAIFEQDLARGDWYSLPVGGG